MPLDRSVSASDAISLITSGMRVFSHGASATPTPLLQALSERTELENVRLYHLHTDGPAPWELTPGAGVVTTRGHVHWVVTEYGIVNLHGLSIRERAEALISISHPDFRAELTRDSRIPRS